MGSHINYIPECMSNRVGEHCAELIVCFVSYNPVESWDSKLVIPSGLPNKTGLDVVSLRKSPFEYYLTVVIRKLSFYRLTY